MDKQGIRLIIVGVLGCIFITPILAGLAGNGWIGLLYIPFVLMIAIPIKREIKGVLASNNHGVEPDIKATDILKEYAKPRTWLYMIPFYLPLKQTIYNTRVWKLNRKQRTLKQTLKRYVPYVEDGSGNRITITSRGVIAVLVVASWIVFMMIGLDVLKLNSVNSFEVAGGGGSAVLFALVGLYISRRRRKLIVKNIKKPHMGKYYFVFSSVFISAVIGITFYSIHSDLTVGGLGAVIFGGMITGVAYLRGVRGRGFHLEKWKGMPTKFKVKSANYHGLGNPFKTRGNLDKSYLDKNPFKDD